MRLRSARTTTWFGILIPQFGALVDVVEAHVLASAQKIGAAVVSAI